MKNFLALLGLSALAALNFTACDNEGPTVPLPQTIQSYLDANYPNAEIEELEMDTLCTGAAVYEVELEVNDDQELELTFDGEGNLSFTSEEIPVGQLPAEVTAAIAAKYSGYTTKEVERNSLANGGTQYEVEIKGTDTREVLLNADGTVVCDEVETDEDGE